MTTQSISVFVVEDEALIAMELRDRLSSLGYTIRGSASHGEQAIEAILNEPPNVVLMDIRLAGKLTGIETAARLSRHVDVPVIFLSAFSDAELLRQATQVEPFGYLVKPFEERELHATIQMALYKHRMERALREAKASLEEKVRERTAQLAESRETLEHQGRMLGVLRRVQEQFIASPDSATPFEEILGALLEFTSSEFGFIGEVLRQVDGKPYLKTHAISNIAWDERTRLAYAEQAAAGIEFYSVNSLFGAVMKTGLPVISNEPATDIRRGGLPAGHPPLHTFLGVPIRVGANVVGMIAVANRPGGYDERMITELQPLLATYGSLILARRNSARRRSAEESLRALNANLESEVQRRTAALMASEQRYSELVANINEAIIRDDVEGRLVYANPRFLELFGLEGRNVRDIVLEDIVAPEWRRFMRDRHERRIRGEEVPDRFEFEGLTASEQHLWIDISTTPVLEQGRIVGTQSVMRDVTGQKQTERALRVLSTELVSLEGTVFFERLVERLAAALDCGIAAVAQIIPAEQGALQALALFQDGKVETSARLPLADSGRQAMLSGRSIVIASGARQHHPEDPYFLEKQIESYAAVPLTDRAGNVFGCLAVMDRHPLAHPARVEAILHLFAVSAAAEIERQRSAQRFHDLFEFSPDAIVMTDRSGTIRLLNRKAEAMFGWSREELTGKGIEVLMPEEDREQHVELRDRFVRSAVSRPMGSARPDLHAMRKDRTIFPVEISLGSIETGDGLMVAAAVRDMTERKNAQRHASRAQRMESIGTLAGGIAHDLNNALTPILMMIDLLKDQYPRETETLDTMERSARHAAEMVRHLLSFARGTEGRRVSVQPLQLMHELEKIVKGIFPKNIHLELRMPRELPSVLGDATQLHQVLLNLCVNARDAMPDGGTLTLEAGVDRKAVFPGSSELQEYGEPSQYVVLRVTDTGTGIAPEFLDRIFDPFFTTKGPEMGTGLGLFTAAGIIKGHGGFIRVDSKPLYGSTFAVYLPAAKEAQRVPVSGHPAQEFRGGGETILYVDDEGTVRDAARAVLTRLNFKPLIASDGMGGLTQAVQHRAELRAVITDAHMPNMDGLAFVRALRRSFPELPIILASGRLDSSLAQEFRKVGVQVILDKPFTQTTLAEALRSALNPAEPVEDRPVPLRAQSG